LSKLAEYLETTLIPQFTAQTADIDSLIEPILVLAVDRLKTQQEQIPEYFWPVTGPHRIRDLHKAYVDDESYHSGHGRVYDSFGIEPETGALVVVRPDQHVAMICALDDSKKLMSFFQAFMIPRGTANSSSRL
jgi:phenol 2-monooxygenase (NADPH)